MGQHFSGREAALERMRDALARLARHDVMSGGGFDAALRAVLETSADALDVERVGYWSIAAEPTRIRLVDLFERALGRHSSGVELTEADYPAYFAALATRRVVPLDHAQTDPRSSAFTEAYLAPNGITSMLDAPVHAGGRCVGVVCHEHVGPARVWNAEEIQFAQTVADLLAMAMEIRERKKTEAELVQTRDTLQSLIHLLPLALVRVDAQGCVTLWNGAAERLFGWSAAEILGQPVPTTPPGYEASFRRVQAGGDREGQLLAFESVRLRKDGTPVEVGIWGGSDTESGAMALYADLTERRRTERALRDSEERWRSVASNAPAIIVEVDRRGRITFINYKPVGYESVEPLGREIYEFVDQPEIPREALARVFGAEESVTYEVSSRAPDGTTSWYSSAVGPAFDEAGNVDRAVIVTVDITGRRRAEAALVASEARLRAVLDRALDAIVLMDEAGRVVEFNPSAEAMFGWRREELLGADMADHIIPERLRESHRKGLARFVETGVTHIQNRRVQMPALRRTGQEFPVELAIVAVPGADPPLFAGFVRDITDQRAAEAEILAHRERLESLVAARTSEIAAVNRELEAFSYSVSHDLRAPLRSIDGYSTALLEDYAGRLDPTAQDYLGRVRGASHRMTALIDSLLHLSRVSRADMVRQRVDLSGMARAVVADLKRSAPERAVEVTIAPDVTACGDPDLLRIVLENLLGNAWKFTSKHPRARIEFGVDASSGERVYFVRDDGAGFDPGHADRLFTVFQRLHSTSEFEGTGIGLATVQRIVHRHGGRLRAEGAVEKGARFWFTLDEGLPAR